MAIDGAMIAIQGQADRLAAMVHAYSNAKGREIELNTLYYGCKELGWVCKIEVKR